MLRPMALAAAAAAVAALVIAGGADAAVRGSGTVTTSARWYSNYMVVRANFVVYDDGSCMPDEYGLYDDPDCYSYDENDADLDVRVWRSTSAGWRLVHSEEMSGFSGKASTTLFYSFDLGLPYYCSRRVTWYFKYAVRLFDPVTDERVDQRTVPFRIYCS